MRLLVIRLSSLGDVVLTDPVAQAFKARRPEVSIDLVTDTAYLPVMERSAFDRVHGYDRHGADRGLSGLIRVANRLDREGYQVVADLHGKPRTWLLASRISAARRLRILRPRWGRSSITTHTVTAYLGVFEEELGGTVTPRPPQLRSASSTRSAGPIRLGLGVGSRHPTKRWPHFADLAVRLKAVRPDLQLVLVGGADDGTTETGRALSARGLEIEASGERLSLSELTELIGTLDAFVGVDSGPAHVAQALGVPSIVLFGPTSPERWGPLGAAHSTVSLGLSCAPCSSFGGKTCPEPARNHECLRALEPERVESQVLDILERSGR